MSDTEIMKSLQFNQPDLIQEALRLRGDSVESVEVTVTSPSGFTLRKVVRFAAPNTSEAA